MAPVHHFMLADLLASLLAVCLYPLFVVVPGYSLAWRLDLCGFRRRTPAFRAALALCLSMSAGPIVTYLVERFGSQHLVWAMYGALWLYFLVVVVRGWRRERPLRVSRQDAVAVGIVVLWVAVALFSLVDLQFGHQDYYPIPARDAALRTGFTHSIAAGIPPHNPFFFPGYPAPLRYHYFWMIPGALVERAGGGAVGPQHAWFGGAAWAGIGMMAMVALTFRILLYRGPASFRRRAFTGILLLGVTGLDILPAAIGWILRSFGMQRAVTPSIDWWNEQVDGFPSTAIWVAHHMVGLVACMTAFLLLWEGARQTARRARVRHALVAGLALASAAGISIFVTLVFSAFLAVWTLVAAARRWWPETAACLLAGMVAVACAAPYLIELPGTGQRAIGPPLMLEVRPFSPAVVVLQSVGITGGWRVSLANLLLLPVNYFMELGFFFAAGSLWWLRRPRPLSRAQLATAIMLATSFLLCSFVRSSVIFNNDLGWRGILLAQFVLVLWGVDVVTGATGPLAVPVRRWLAVLALLGASGVVYDIFLLRLYPVAADRGVLAMLSWLAPDHRLGERNYAQREAYEWLDGNSDPRARIQFNPHVEFEDVPAFLYGKRQIVAADTLCLATFGGDLALCPPIQAVLDRLYTEPGQPAPAAIADTCRSLPADYLVAKDTDAVWRDPRSWVWREQPVFANRYVRLFGCGAAAGNVSGSPPAPRFQR